MSGDAEATQTAFIGLGSNVGRRGVHLEAARSAIKRTPGIRLSGASMPRETKPVDNLDQPDFLNQVVSIETQLPPLRLLEALQAIEDRLGRERVVWKGPRTIDLDILLYGVRVIEDPGLRVPHPALLRRPFWVRQILEIDPDVLEPVSGRRLSTFLAGD